MSPHPSQLIRLLCLLCCLAASAVQGAIPASGRMVFRAHGPAEGLEHTSLTTLTQDAAGFLWVGTEGGAYRFDGTTFRLWSLQDGLPSAWVRTFAPMPDGSLWIGTRAGLCRYQDGRIHPLDPRDPLAKAHIHRISQDDRGRIWVAAQSGLFRNEGGTSRFAAVSDWPVGPAFSLAPEGTGMWVGGASVLRHLADGEPARVWSPQDGVPEEPVKALLKSRSGDLWIRTPNHLQVLRLGGHGLTLPARGLPPLAVSFYEESLASDSEGGVFVPTAKGLLHFPANGTWALLSEDRGIPNGWVNQALVDRAGNLWLANLGLHLQQGDGSWQNFTRRDGLPADTTWGILRDRKGILWVSTSNGLARMGAGGPKPFHLGVGLVLYAMKEGADGSIWGAGEHPFLVRISPDRKVLARIPLPPSSGLAIPVALAFDAAGSLWIATSNDGLWQLKDPGGRRTFLRIELPGTGELGQITGLHLDGRDRLWVTTGRGLACLDQGRWHLFGAEVGLHPSPLWTMAPMADGTLWLGYLEPLGLTRLDLTGDLPRFLEHRTRRDGLASDSVYSLVADSSGNLWVGGPRGVQRIQGGNQRLFRREDGLAGTDCNPFSTWADPDGGLWFGSTAGLLHHHPASGGPPSPPPTAMLMSVSLGHRSWETPILGTADLGSVPYRDRTLSARFTSLEYQHKGRLRFQARLIGLEDDWVELGTRDLRYPALPSGSYQLQVRAMLEDVGTGPVTTARFEVLPPWWLRWWAWVLWLLLTGLATLLSFRWRLQHLRRGNEELQALVRERTEALELSNLALATISTTDPLTGLHNRRYLEEQLPGVLALVLRAQRDRAGSDASPDACLVFAMLDIDHFKRVNDTWSHTAGDLALSQIAEVLRREARESDFLIRWGGEEILFVGHTSDLEGAATVVSRLHQAIRNHPFELELPETVNLTCSLGFSLFPFQPDHLEAASWEDQVRVADRCLYAAKRSGRDGWVGVTALPGAPVGLPGRFDHSPDTCIKDGTVDLRSSTPNGHLTWN